jgi:hypothetical protein
MHGGEIFIAALSGFSFTQQSLYFQEKKPWDALKRRLGGPQRQCGYSGGETKSLAPCQTFNPELPSHYTE